MKALVTGASSGIGREIAKYLSTLGYEIIAVARDRDKLKTLKDELITPVRIISLDLSESKNCRSLFALLEKEEIDILVNDAGFGQYGNFDAADLERELQMIGVNVQAVHILTKLFLRQMLQRGSGYIMNVSSLTAFMPGPQMATYYATKAYVLRLTQAIQEELREMKSSVHVCALCPTAVQTNFQNVANVEFDIPNQCPEFVAKAAVDGMLRGQKIILPGVDAKTVRVVSKLSPDSLNGKLASAVMRPKVTELEKVQYTWEIAEP